MLYGNLPPAQWRPLTAGATSEPWQSFERALELLRAGDHTSASREWQRITTLDGIESRHVLQAWHFLRGVGIRPPEAAAADVLGAIAEVAVNGGHDVLAAYRDGSVRYLNYSGKVLVVEGEQAAVVGDAVAAWFEIAQALAHVVGVWDEPQLPSLPAGATRILMLTPGGLRFGQGPDSALRGDRAAAAFLAAATRLLTEVTALVR